MSTLPDDDPVACARRVTDERGLPVVDVVSGVFGVALPGLDGPTFVRLGRPAGDSRDRARAVYLLAAGRRLRRCVGGWLDGPGVVVDAPGADGLLAEIEEIAAGLRALAADIRIARGYLELCEPCVVSPTRVVAPGRDATARPDPASVRRATPEEDCT